MPIPTVDHSAGMKVLPFILSVVAGSVDVISFLGLNQLFTAHITGNLVILAAHIVAGTRASLALVISVPVFIGALVATRVLAAGLERGGISSLGVPSVPATRVALRFPWNMCCCWFRRRR
jgi:uncharacterized membrane protein YoaK (UPF0700 family)